MPIKTRTDFLTRFMLAPPSPTRFSTQQSLAASAVLIPMYESERGLEVVFTTRSQHLRHHAGQICFPGGRSEHHDNSLADTALREFEEELGVDRAQVELLGQLPDMPVVSRFLIRPYVGFLAAQPQWQPDANEVGDGFSVPLHELLQHQQHFAFTAERLGMQRIWFIPWQQRIIWGATAGIVRSLSEQLRPEYKALYRPLN